MNILCLKREMFRSRANRNIPGILLVTVLFLLTETCNLRAEPTTSQPAESKSQPLSKEDIQALWKTLSTIKVSEYEKEKYPDKKTKIQDGSVEYWGLIMALGFSEMQKIVMSSNPREGLTYFVDQFGKNDAQTDMRWLLAARTWNLTPDKYLRPNHEQQKRKTQLLFSELMVRKFLKSPAALKRYYQAVTWFNNLFEPLFFPVCQGTIDRAFLKEKQPDDDYWWHAFQFVMMAHATGRDDLLQNVKAEELRPRFRRWYTWFQKEGMYLRPSSQSWYWEMDQGEKSRQEGYLWFLLKQHLPPLTVRPETPFPDWNGPKPTTPANYRSME